MMLFQDLLLFCVIAISRNKIVINSEVKKKKIKVLYSVWLLKQESNL